MSDSTRDGVVFVGYAVPDEAMERLLVEDPFMPIQTHRFGWSVIEAMKSAGVNVEVVSTLPAGNYPLNPHVWISGQRFSVDGTRGRSGGYLNLAGMKHAFRFVWITAALTRLGLSSNKPLAFIVHGSATPLVGASLLVGRALGVPVVMVLTDRPAWRGKASTALGEIARQIDDRLTHRLTSSVNGVIALTGALASEFVPGKPHLLMEGIAPTVSRKARINDLPLAGFDDGSFHVVYGGGLRAEYGVADLVRAMNYTDDSVRLHIFGKGPLEITATENVIPHGMIDPADLFQVMQRADLLVNPRPPAQDFTKYSFPSKLMEYLLTGTPAVTTRLPGIPEDYDDLFTWAEAGPQGLAAAIDQVRTSYGEAVARAAAARDFVLTNKSVEAQGKRIIRFVRSLDHERRAGPKLRRKLRQQARPAVS